MHWTLYFILSLLVACVHQPETTVPPGASTLQSAQTVHAAALVLDAHADIEIPGKYSAYVGDDGLSQVAPDKMRKGAVDAVVMSISVSAVPRTKLGYENARVRAGEELNAVMSLAEANDGLVLVRSPAELVEAHQKGQQAVILGVQNAALFAQELANIDLYYEQGVRVFAFTHLGHNAFADSSRPGFIRSTGKHEPEAEHGGLSA